MSTEARIWWLSAIALAAWFGESAILKSLKGGTWMQHHTGVGVGCLIITFAVVALVLVARS